MEKLSIEDQDGKARKVFDLVCGMEMGIETVRYAFEHEGKEYYFCSETCKGRFVSDPDMYTGQH